MLPTIERELRRSTYSSETWKALAALPFRDCPPRRRRPAGPLASSTATRVSPASTETRIRFFKLTHLTRASDRPRGVLPRCRESAPLEGGRPALGGEPRLHVDALQEADRDEG